MRKALLLGLVLLLGSTPGLLAQISTGNIYGTVSDESGGLLPGAAVALTSEFGTRNTTTGSQGEFRFLNLERGRYKLAVSLAGFTSVNRAQLEGTGEGKVESQANPGIRRGELVLQAGMGLELEPNACLNTHRVNIGTGVLVTANGCEPLNELPSRVHHVATGP